MHRHRRRFNTTYASSSTRSTRSKMEKTFLSLDQSYKNYTVAGGASMVQDPPIFSAFPGQVREYEFVRKRLSVDGMSNEKQLLTITKYSLTYTRGQQSGPTTPEMTIASTTYGDALPGDKYTTVDVNNGGVTTNPISFAVWDPSITQYTFRAEIKKLPDDPHAPDTVVATISVVPPAVKYDGELTGLPEGVEKDKAMEWDEDRNAIGLIESVTRAADICNLQYRFGIGIAYQVTNSQSYKAEYGFLQVLVPDYEIVLSSTANVQHFLIGEIPAGQIWLDGEGIEIVRTMDEGVSACVGFGDAPDISGSTYYGGVGTASGGCAVGQEGGPQVAKVYTGVYTFQTYLMMRVVEVDVENYWVPVKKFNWSMLYSAVCAVEGGFCGIVNDETGAGGIGVFKNPWSTDGNIEWQDDADWAAAPHLLTRWDAVAQEQILVQGGEFEDEDEGYPYGGMWCPKYHPANVLDRGYEFGATLASELLVNNESNGNTTLGSHGI